MDMIVVVIAVTDAVVVVIYRQNEQK